MSKHVNTVMRVCIQGKKPEENYSIVLHLHKTSLTDLQGNSVNTYL